MNIKRILKGAGALCLSAAMALSGGMGVFAAENDVIDSSRMGSLTIHKYDITAAEADGIDVSDLTATGKTDAEAEERLSKYAIKGVEFTYLRVGSVETMSIEGDVKLIYEMPETLCSILGLKPEDAARSKNGKVYFTSQQINDAMAQALTNNTTAKDKLEAYAKAGTKMPLTDAEGKTGQDELRLGLYLIVETKVPEDVVYTTNPWFVQLPMTDSTGDHWFYDVICYPKNQTGFPTLDKKVRNNPDAANIVTASEVTDSYRKVRKEYAYADTTTASEGELLDYQLISKLPHITSKATYLNKYTFTDNLAAGITYGRDAVIAFYDSPDTIPSANKNNVADTNPVAVWPLGSDRFKQRYQTTGNENRMEIEMTDKGLEEINKHYSDKYMAVCYTAAVNTGDTVTLGDKGNANDVSLEWRRTSTEHYDILKDECIVYTFGIDLMKEFSDGEGDATKVQFVLRNTMDNYFVKADGDGGHYHVTGKSADEKGATQFSPAADGNLVIEGIEGDVYELTETHSDAGYSLLKEPALIEIKTASAQITPTTVNITGIQSKPGADSTANDGAVKGEELAGEVSVQTTAASAQVDRTGTAMKNCKNCTESTNALVSIKVLNSKGFLLPQTGGRGLYLITILGMAIAAFGLSFTFRKKKNR